MSFTSKVTARNLLRYKARFLMTVLGVAGCTALIIAGFGIKDSISVIVDKQFQEIYKYDTVIVTKSSNDFEQAKPLFNDVNADSRIAGAALVEQKAVKAFSDKSSEKSMRFMSLLRRTPAIWRTSSTCMKGNRAQSLRCPTMALS